MICLDTIAVSAVLIEFFQLLRRSVDRISSIKLGEMNPGMLVMEKPRPSSLLWDPVSSADVGPPPPVSFKSSKPKRASRLSISISAD